MSKPTSPARMRPVVSPRIDGGRRDRAPQPAYWPACRLRTEMQRPWCHASPRELGRLIRAEGDRDDVALTLLRVRGLDDRMAGLAIVRRRVAVRRVVAADVPQLVHMRRCTHRPPIFRQSSQPGISAGSSVTVIESRCEQLATG
jgi:hypothetical protein